MNNVTIDMTLEEAAIVAASLRFVASNLTLDDSNGLRRFCSGGQFACSIEDLFNISYIAASLDEARENAAEIHPFNPCINHF